jgi:hypothetical protein
MRYNILCITFVADSTNFHLIFQPELSDFLLDLHRSLAHQSFAKIRA